ncbi:MAG: TAXI family TRAP transporter solute-binding subunit [Deltaproteobacteria bacterium]|nr:TAXI family TRAP transporter solute-binding subunit [Deltaproteobacteria bacterium]
MKRLLFVLLSISLVFLVSQPSWALDAQKLRIATMEMGSSWYVYGGAMASVLRKELPGGSVIDVLPYAGGGNMNLVSTGDVELGLGFPVAGKWAFEGQMAYDKKMPNLRGLVGGFDEYYVGIVATKKSKITSLEDVAKKKMPIHLATVPTGGVGEFACRQIMEAVGAPYKTIESFGGKVTHTSFGVITKMMVDGQADVFMQVVTAGHPAMTEIAITADVVFLGLSDEVVKKLSALGWSPATLPAKTFQGQTTPVHTIGTTTSLIASDKLPNDTAYAVTKALCENRDALGKGHAGLKYFNPQVAWKPANLGVPLHPGAEKYYKEKGWMK